jgi:hypothetical protein
MASKICRRSLLVLITAILIATNILAKDEKVIFTKLPIAVTKDGQITITFEVSRFTDASVFVENAKGKIICHLASGVLGENPPEPFQKNSLQQSVVWDGKADYGKLAEDGPFQVRVSLGLGVEFNKKVISNPLSFTNIKGLAVGQDGSVFIMHQTGGAVWRGEELIKLNRDGSYQETLIPFSNKKKLEEVKSFGAFELRGEVAALVHHHRLNLFPGAKCPRKTAMIVSPDGKMLSRITGSVGEDGTSYISTLGVNGNILEGNFLGKPNFTQTVPPSKDGRYHGALNDRATLAFSSDGHSYFLSGENNYPIIFKSTSTTRNELKPFFGDYGKIGKDKSSLGGSARGLAVDGKGNLYISDFANDRVIIIDEKTGDYKSEFPVIKPDWIAVHIKTGSIYVVTLENRMAMQLLKIKSANEPTLLSKTPIISESNGTFVAGLDSWSDNPYIWYGTDGGSIFKIEDKDNKFIAIKISDKEVSNNSFLDMSVDRFQDVREIYCRNGTRWWYRFNESTEKLERVDVANKNNITTGGGSGLQVLSGPDKNLYGLGYPMHMYKFDRDGNGIGFTEESQYPDSIIGRDGAPRKIGPGPKSARYVPVSMTDMTHTLGIRGDGHVFVFEPSHPGERPNKALHEYLPTGKKVTSMPIVWNVSDGAVGPKFDAKGNIYIAEIVNTGKRAYPEEFEKMYGVIEMQKTRPSGVQDEIANMYGSIVKFSSKGGAIHYKNATSDYDNPYTGEIDLDKSVKTFDAGYYVGQGFNPIKISAEWISFGYSHVETRECICETTRFDVDEFGRVWFPDLCLFQVRVIDTNGNSILNFGKYGNEDSQDLAFAWLVGVAVTDKFVYTGDSINRRMLQSKLKYQVQETCKIAEKK